MGKCRQIATVQSAVHTLKYPKQKYLQPIFKVMGSEQKIQENCQCALAWLLAGLNIIFFRSCALEILQW